MPVSPVPMMSRVVLLAGALALASPLAHAQAPAPAAPAAAAAPAIPPAELGGLVAQTCAGCHGADYAGAGSMPTLRGRPAAELQTKMTEFRANARYSTVMGRLARGLTETEIAAVSTYLSTLR